MATAKEVKASQTATTGGRKFDGGKLQYGLLPPLALKATVEILTFGAEKYEPDNWKHVPDSKRRYFDAMQRHLWAWKSGEQNAIGTDSSNTNWRENPRPSRRRLGSDPPHIGGFALERSANRDRRHRFERRLGH